MAAVALDLPNLVWQRVFQMLGGQAGTGSVASADPSSVNAFRALKLQLATQKLGIQLQFVPFAEADIDAATGFAGPTGSFNLYGIWAKKSGTGTTRAFVQVYNKNDMTGAGETGALLALPFKAVSDEALAIFPKGLTFNQTTGSRIASVTTIGGSTATTGDSDSQHGFLVIGA